MPRPDGRSATECNLSNRDEGWRSVHIPFKQQDASDSNTADAQGRRFNSGPLPGLHELLTPLSLVDVRCGYLVDQQGLIVLLANHNQPDGIRLLRGRAKIQQDSENGTI